MSESYGARRDREDRERRAMRDSRDQRYGAERSPYGEDHNDQRYGMQSTGRQSLNRDNEYRFDSSRGGGYGYEQGRGDRRSNDDYYGRGGQSEWNSRWYPQQRSFERSGYDSDREFWEGQRAGQSYQPGRYGSQRSDYPMSGGRSGASAYPQRPLRSEDYRSGSWDHERDSHDAGQRAQSDYARGSSFPQQGSHGRYSWGEEGDHRHGGYGELGQHGSAGGYRWSQGGQQHGRASGDDWNPDGRNLGYSSHQGGLQGGDWQQRERFGSAGGAMSGSHRGRAPKGYTRSDERLREDVCEQLMNTPFIDASDVSVEVKDGRVILEGTVPERFMKHRMEDLAHEVNGVKDVEIRIRVPRPGSESAGDQPANLRMSGPGSTGTSQTTGQSASSVGSASTGGSSSGTHGSTQEQRRNVK